MLISAADVHGPPLTSLSARSLTYRAVRAAVTDRPQA